jgi:hypothetical protein
VGAGDARAFAERCLEVHEDEARWSALRSAALARVERDCAPAEFADRLREALR